MNREEALEILRLKPGASLEEAKKAYYALVKHYHPDKNPASNASVMFRIIQDAWEVILKDTKDTERAHAEVEAAYAEEIIRKEGEVENWIRGFSIGTWFIFWFFFRESIELPEDTTWFWIAIGTTGIILGEIVVKIRRWFGEETADTHQEP